LIKISFVNKLMICFVVLIIRFNDNSLAFMINASVFRIIVELLLIKFDSYWLIAPYSGLLLNILYVCLVATFIFLLMDLSNKILIII
jgi:hypothetical protein